MKDFQVIYDFLKNHSTLQSMAAMQALMNIEEKMNSQSLPGPAILHRILVILDDYYCNTFGFNRKARGKYDDNRRSTT